ncbi:hypothetical protein QYM36_017343 [Artemia franciscana]|uniref:Uncharacterized protein n=1 Tax=Artemia franciscana TaxID=6661 RepID=A0AA88H5F3_ARTSF|nr:hypothetical protein QYM36_017343 [Artemia franciscana]
MKAYENWLEVTKRMKSYSIKIYLPEDSPEWYVNELNYVTNLRHDFEPESYQLENFILELKRISLRWCLFFCYVKQQLKANDPILIVVIRAIEHTKDNFYKPLKAGIFNHENLEEAHQQMQELQRVKSNSFDDLFLVLLSNSKLQSRQRSKKKINHKVYDNENTDSNSDQPKAKQSGHTKKRLNVKKHSKRSPSLQREGSLETNNNSDEEGENEIQHVRARLRLKQQKPPIRHLSFEEDEVEEPIDSDPAGNESSDSRKYGGEKDSAYCFACSLFQTGPGHTYRNKDFVARTRNWHKTRSKGVKPGMLITHFQSNSHKDFVSDLISFVARYKSLPYLVDKEKLRKDIESEKEKERGRCIICMLLGITTSIGKQGLASRSKDYEGGNYAELAILLSRHNSENESMDEQAEQATSHQLSVGMQSKRIDCHCFNRAD